MAAQSVAVPMLWRPAPQGLEDEEGRSASLATGEAVSSPRHKVGGQRAGRVEVALTQGNRPGPGFAATGENIEDRRQFHRLG